MKKIIALLVMVCTIGLTAFAQQTVTKDKDKEKVRKTSTLGQKVHNTFSRHKHHNGYVVKTKKDDNGHIVKTKKKVKEDDH
jgi:hypothetical protein